MSSNSSSNNRLLMTPSSSGTNLLQSLLAERRGSRASAASEDEERQHLLESDNSEQSPQLETTEVASRKASSAGASSISGGFLGAANTYGSFDENMASTANGKGTGGQGRGRNIFPVHVSLSDSRLHSFQIDSPNSENHHNGQEHRENGFSPFSSSTNSHYAVVELDQDEKIKIWAYETCWWKLTLMWIASFLTLGLFRLVLYWYPKWYVACTSVKSTFSNCTDVLVLDDHQNEAFRRIKITKANSNDHLCVPYGERHLTVKQIRFFTYRKITYIWHPIDFRFATVDQLEGNPTTSYIHRYWREQVGLDSSEIQRRLILYGKNLIDVKLKPIIVLLCKEVITPFYIFQVFSVAVWYSDDYAYYASIIVLMSVASISMDVYQIRRQEKKLRSMVHSEDMVEVLRNGGVKEEISSSMLVPGDIILIPPHGCILQCDCVLMNGTVILNESMLTGESVPVTKVALPEAESGEKHEFTFKEHTKHIMFCGTTVLQTRFYAGKPVQAIVLRTAYSTLKGQLVRSIMYPKPVDFRFTKDLFRFVGFLSVIALMGFIYTIAIMIIRDSPTKKIILRSLDIITIVVPPALPAVMSIGILAAQMRLKAKQIFCTSPSTINTCGAINVVVFDKTGTLTEDGLDFHCVRAVHTKPKQTLSSSSTDSSALDFEFGDELSELHMDELPRNGELVKAVASCHSLTRIDNVLCGDPLDLILFNKTNWIINETEPDQSVVDETALFDMLQPTVVRSPPAHFGSESDTELAIIRQFTFSSSLQRMAVIVHNPSEPGRQMHLYVKGAPEIIASLCTPESVPSTYQDVVNGYAQHGYRLIAVACRQLDMNYVKAQKVKREVIEKDLTLLGLVVMENRVKKQTVPVITQLNRAHIRTIMATGDNLLTAMSVARECGIIRPHKRAFLLEHGGLLADGRVHLILKQSVSSSEELSESDETSLNVDGEAGHLFDSSYQLAVSGATFAAICRDYPELVEQLVCVCDVYARMSPDQKQLVVNRLQDVDYTVAMCGDGANDCAALKSAHAGISLSEAEASIAAPFTSKIPDIRCVPMVIREGRGALVTSFGVFKYMAGYSLTQFITIMQLYWLNTNLTDFQFLYIDLGLVTLIAFFFGYTPACDKLYKVPPPARLLSLASATSIVGQLMIVACFQLFTFIYTAQQPWFIPYIIPAGEAVEDRRSMQGTAIFCVSTFQYVTLAIIYSKGLPYRKPFFHNRPMCVSILILTLLSAYITVFHPTIAVEWLEFDPIPYMEDRVFLLLLAILSGVCSYLFETYVIEHMLLGVRERFKKRQQLNNDSSDVSRYERVVHSIGNEPFWLRNQTIAGLRSEPNLLSPIPANPSATNKIEHHEPLILKVDEENALK